MSSLSAVQVGMSRRGAFDEDTWWVMDFVLEALLRRPKRWRALSNEQVLLGRRAHHV